MRKYLPAFAIFAVATSPALAQTAPSEPAPEAKPKTMKKVVCQRIETDRGTGSRLGPTTRQCKTIEVPVPGNKDAQTTQPQGHNANAH